MTKVCTKCGEDLPATAEFFYRDRSKPDSLRPDCKRCWNLKAKKYYQEHRTENKPKKAKYYHNYYNTLNGRLRNVYKNLNDRCCNPKNRYYKDYGGRGIQNRFKNFDDFYNYVNKDLGVVKVEQLEKMQIDRIDNNGHYEKGNIRFVTCKENNNNRGY